MSAKPCNWTLFSFFLTSICLLYLSVGQLFYFSVLAFCLTFYSLVLSIILSTVLSVCCRSVCLLFFLSFRPAFCLTFFGFVFCSVNHSVCLPVSFYASVVLVCLSVSQPFCMSIVLSAFLSIIMSAVMSVILAFYLGFYLLFCLFIILSNEFESLKDRFYVGLCVNKSYFNIHFTYRHFHPC